LGHQDIAVIDHQDGIAGRRRQVHQHAHLAVRRRRRADHEPYGAVGELASEPLDLRNGGVGRIRNPEQDLEVRVILESVRADALGEVRIQAVHGLEDGNRRRPPGAALAPPEAPERGCQSQALVGERRRRNHQQ
jgi:hypothetical protein